MSSQFSMVFTRCLSRIITGSHSSLPFLHRSAFPMIFKREINNQKVFATLVENPGKTLSDIHGSACDKWKYIDEAGFNALPKTDREALDDTLFTYTGYYALDSKHITVDEFLSIPEEARRRLQYFFHDADEIYWGAQNIRDLIDAMFEKKHFDIGTYTKLPDEKRKSWVNFLSVPSALGMKAIEKGYFSREYLFSLDIRAQEELVSLFRRLHWDHRPNFHSSHYEHVLEKALEAFKKKYPEKIAELTLE